MAEMYSKQSLKSKIAEVFLKACVTNTILLSDEISVKDRKILEFKKTQYRNEIQFYENLLTEEF